MDDTRRTGSLYKATTVTEQHLVTLRRVPCGEPACREIAHHWMRCRRCRDVVARCGAHDAKLELQTKEHCPTMTTCRSCNAEIEWAEWAASGKSIPLDVGTKSDGNLAVVSGKVHPYTDADAKLGRERRRSHFASCPDSDRWRNR